jgi:hypothetical protein
MASANVAHDLRVQEYFAAFGDRAHCELGLGR